MLTYIKQCIFFVGQFMLDNIKIDEQYQLIKVGKCQPFPVKKSEVWPFLHIPGECWYGTYTDHQAKGILEGTYTDYITDDLFSTDFKLMFKAKM